MPWAIRRSLHPTRDHRRPPLRASRRVTGAEIPEETILAHGTADPLTDARKQAEFAARGVTMPKVEGGLGHDPREQVTFPDLACDLVPLDRLEGFQPEGSVLYRRSLVAAHAGVGVKLAWVYHMAWLRQGQRLRGGIWQR